MPCLRGVEVSVVVQPGSRELPEFTHPDVSSVRAQPISPHIAADGSSSVSPDSGSGSSHIRKTSPTISVYIPSVPGARFCIRYATKRLFEPPCYLFFKVSMNGRDVASWGINPAVHASGSVTRALYEPSDKCCYKEAGVVIRREGIESRCFYFASPQSTVSVAEDGGLIEVHILRARGRRPRAPFLNKFRAQEQYGIASPSTGLLDRPEETFYYDWILIDPKDSPFASFRFHYRSSKNLHSLHLGSDEAWLSWRDSRSLPGHQPCVYPGEWRKGAWTTAEKEWWTDGDVLIDDIALQQAKSANDTGKSTGFHPGSPQRPQQAASPSHQPRISKPGDTYCNGFLGNWTSKASASARKPTDSSAPSVALSLLQYLEEGSVGIEDVEYGMATEIPVHLDPLLKGWGKRPLPQLPRRGSSSSSLYGRPQLSSLELSSPRPQQREACEDVNTVDETSVSTNGVGKIPCAFETLTISEEESWMRGD